MSLIRTGNAAAEGRARRGWFLGHFLPEDAPLHSHDVEVKWAHHAAGEERSEWTQSAATTLSILVRGRFTLLFEDGPRTLSEEGDYALWSPGVPHTWRAEADSLIVTVRWPSD